MTSLLRRIILACALLLSVIIVVEAAALAETIVVQRAVDLYSQSERMVSVPRWILTSHLWFDANRAGLTVLIWIGFEIACALLIWLAQERLETFGLPPKTWVRAMPIALLIPFANLLIPWIGLGLTRRGLARIVSPKRHAPIDPRTLLFAASFDVKVVMDGYIFFHLQDPYLLYAEKVRWSALKLSISALLLVAFVLYWRSFERLLVMATRVQASQVVKTTF